MTLDSKWTFLAGILLGYLLRGWIGQLLYTIHHFSWS